MTPYVVDHVTDRDGKVVYRAAPPRVPQQEQAKAAPGVEVTPAADTASADPANPAPVFAPQVIDPRNAFIMNSMLQDVIKRGTGRKALELGRNDLAGKTGTTNESKDTWFSGYNGDYVTTVWSGFDQPETLGRQEFGGTVALPIWMKYMGAALKDKPPHQLKEPDGIVSIRVDPTTGRAAPPGTPNAYFELFKSEDTPPSLDELPPGVAPGTPLPSSENVPMDIF